MTDSVVKYRLTDRVAVIEMDDGKVNALNPKMIDGVLESLVRAEEEARAVVLAGRPDKFCAGFDLKILLASAEAARGLLRQGADLYLRLYGCGLPLVIACTGHALAGGSLVLLTGDHRIGAEGRFQIGLNEVAIGLPVPILAMEVARDRLDPRALTAATLLARVYAPDEAVPAGYLDETAPPEEVIDRAIAHAKALTRLDRGAFARSKETLRGATIRHIRETLESDLAGLKG